MISREDACPRAFLLPAGEGEGFPLLRKTFLLLTGAKALEVSGPFPFVTLNPPPQDQLADLGDTSFFSIRDLLEDVLEFGIDADT